LAAVKIFADGISGKDIYEYSKTVRSSETQMRNEKVDEKFGCGNE